MTGTASRKLNSAAAAGARPPHSAAQTVEPDRETPRNTAATACAKPMATAPATVGSGRAPPPSRRVDQFMNPVRIDRKSTRLNSSHTVISYAVFCLKKKKKQQK